MIFLIVESQLILNPLEDNYQAISIMLYILPSNFMK